MKGPKTITVQKDNQDLVKELAQYKDRNGDLVSQVTQVKLDKKEVEARVDSLAREIKIAKKGIKTVDHYHTDVDTVFSNLPSTVILMGKDTAYKVEQHDKNLDIVAIAGKDTGSIKFHLQDDLDRVEQDKTGLFSFLGFEKGTDIYLRTKSPYIDYKSGYSFTVKEKEIWLTIGPSIQYTVVGPLKNKVSVGFSAQIPLIKIKR